MSVVVGADTVFVYTGELINEDPYGDGWIAKVELAGEPTGLMKATDPEFAEFIAAERVKYGK